jgi:hypothetical protein
MEGKFLKGKQWSENLFQGMGWSQIKELTKEAFCLKTMEDTDDLLGRFHAHLNQVSHVAGRI